MFPPSLNIDTSNTATDVIKISGEGVSVTDVAFEKDESLNYNSDKCQFEPCYTITFLTASTIPLGTRMKLEISNLLNPESIIIAGDLQISTMMKYASDEIYYMIDTAT